MERNIFKFGDTFWKQINGTAMDTSCAVNYAFLYLALLEMVVLMQEFKTWMLFYGRFIDDGFGLWDTQKKKVLPLLGKNSYPGSTTGAT